MRTIQHKQNTMFVMLHVSGRNDLHFPLMFSLMSRLATTNEEQLVLNSAPGYAIVNSLFLCKKLRKSKDNQCRLPMDNQLHVPKINKKKVRKNYSEGQVILNEH